MVREGLDGNYPQLQNLIKRDPESYQEEFQQQFQHFQSAWSLLSAGQDSSPHLEAMLMFVAHCAPLYPQMASVLKDNLISLLEDVDKVSQMEANLRKAVVQAVLLLKRDRQIEPSILIPILFKLLRIKDKSLRELVTNNITQDLRKATPQLSKHVLRFLEETVLAVDGLEDECAGSAAVQSLNILISVYAKGNQSNDARPVNIIANAGLNDKHIKMMLLALNFLIGQEMNSLNEEGDDGSGSEDDKEQTNGDIRDAYSRMRIAGRTKARQSKLDRLVKKSKKKTISAKNTAFPAIQLLYDPQRYAERLLVNLKRSTAPFEAKMTMMNALSLIIGSHQLILPDFYPILLRYLQPHQRKVTKVLCFCAQASHASLPYDCLQVTIRAIANNFVAEHCAAAVIAAGLNAIRECCQRCPGAMDETLLRDLAQYKGFKDKSVMMAARSLIGLYREVDPELLHKKDRGKPKKNVHSANANDESEQDSESCDDSDGGRAGPDSLDIASKAQLKILSEEELQQLKIDSEFPSNDNMTAIHPDSINPIMKKKMNKAERLEHVKAGRLEGRKFGATAKTAEHRASGKSKSNRVKRKAKLTAMLKRSKAGFYGGKKGAKKKRRHA